MAELDSLTVRILGDISDLRKNLSKAERQIEQFGYEMTQVGKSLTVGLTVPLAAMGVAATKLASDAAEAANKFDVVFGASADRARAQIEELHKTIPLTRHEMEGLASSVQDMLVPMGLARSDAADLSVQVLRLAGDLASFNNINADEAMGRILSGFAGESEPLRRWGVDVSAARLEALALEEGLIGVGDELDRTARAHATMLAITRDSGDAMGDAGRTAKDAAATFRFLLRNMKELGVTIGNELLPVVTPLVARLNDLTRSAGGLRSSTVQWGIAIGVVASTLGPLLFFVGKATKAFIALRAATAALSVTMGLGTGGLAFVLAGAAAALAYLATKFVKSKIEAAASATAYRDAARAAAELSEELANLSKRQTAAVATGIAQDIRALEEAKRQLEAELKTAGATEINQKTGNIVAVSADRGRIRRELQEIENQLISLRERYQVAVQFINSNPVDPKVPDSVRDVKVELEQATEQAATFAQVWKAAFGDLPRGDFTPVPDMGIGGAGSVFQGNELKKDLEDLGREADRLHTEVTALVFTFSDSLTDAIRGVDDVFRSFVYSAINQLIRLAAQFAAFKALSIIPGLGGVAAAFGSAAGFDISSLATAPAGGGSPGLQQVSAPAPVLNINVPPARDPISLARDSQWLDALARSADELKYGGYSFQT